MIDLKPTISRIEELLEKGEAANVTYAALEARLALERVAYDRLRQCHDYISHADLKRWQPHQVVNILLKEVDEHVDVSRTFYISKSPALPGVTPPDEDFVKLGTEEGFNAPLAGKLWNALSKLALHVGLPAGRESPMPDYGDTAQIEAKVRETLVELRRLAKTTMTFSGIGQEVSFECSSCGAKNKRRASLLRPGQVVACINPACKGSWKVIDEEDGFAFEANLVEIPCEQCRVESRFPARAFTDMKPFDTMSFSCGDCGHKNFAQWRLTQVKPKP